MLDWLKLCDFLKTEMVRDDFTYFRLPWVLIGIPIYSLEKITFRLRDHFILYEAKV